MKKLSSFIFLAAMALGVFSFANAKQSESVSVEAATQTPGLPRGGSPGSYVFINGCGTYFNDVDLVLYLKAGSTTGWTEKCSYRVYGTDIIAVKLPGGASWTQFQVCRYNKEKNPYSDGWDGVYNHSQLYGFSETFLYSQNYFSITGWDMSISDRSYYQYTHYGIKSNERIYLDMSEFNGWDTDSAKFAIYFGNPMFSGADAWSSMMTKVEGSGNDHLYECTVPYLYDNVEAIWNLAIPVRFDPATEIPGWHDAVWNQTNDIRFDSTNHENNVLKVTGWGSGEIKDEKITRAQRVEMYGQYFMDTVGCSGTGTSDATTSEQWEAVKRQYQNMHTDYQGDVWLTVADSDTSASKIAQAMARYDYIVFFKQYDHEDFVNRIDSKNKTEYDLSLVNYTSPYKRQNNPIVIIAIVSIISLSVVAILIIKRHKFN